MGILDFFGGGSPDEKARKLKAKVTQKYGDATTRQKAIQQLGEMKTPEAVRSLLARFTVNVDPHTTDADEKEHTFSLITGFKQDAVEPVKEFLFKSDQASSWAVRLLRELVPEDELVGAVIEALRRVGNEYTRDPEKKVVLIQALAAGQDARIPDALVPFLEDPSDDVKIAALGALGARKHEPGREPMLQVLTSDETARRVKTAAIAALHEAGFGVQGYRPKVETELKDPWFLDGNGVIKKRE
ncbi:MAG: HEAT repeat domain-containing protein [Myxococcaceae bacterium]